MSRGNICRHGQIKLAVSASPAPVLEEISELIHNYVLRQGSRSKQTMKRISITREVIGGAIKRV
jgi:hypothetical protein